MNKIEQLTNIVKNSKYLVFFGGAGVSTESGLKDFRSKDGLYHEKYSYPPEEILSHHFFIDHTEEFFKFYREKLNSLNYQPNITHQVLAKLEEKDILKSIITQNIDGFHQMAGSKKVLELHGSVLRNYCIKCHKFYDAKTIFSTAKIPKCSCGGIIKPDVILYEEALNEEILKKAIQEITTAETITIGGTFLNVYPAAGLLKYFQGKYIILINKEKTSYDKNCDLTIYENIGEVMKCMYEKLKKRI